MTITYGLSATGYVPKPQDVVRTEINASVTSLRGISTDVSDASLLGQLIGIFSERESALWDLGQAIYSSDDPDAAIGAALEALSALTGTLRAKARASTVTETLTGTPTTLVPSGSQIKTASTGALFATASTATIALLASWANATPYVVGDRRTNAGRAYRCITSGTSASAPTTTAADITDGTVHWKYLGEGTGAIDVFAKSVALDAIVAVAGDLTSIQTPVGGWSNAVNLLDATPGAKAQSDSSLRLTREAELAQSGNSPADAIRSKLLQISGVTAVTVYHNDTDLTDVNGLTPHTVEALVTGGSDNDIATILSENVAAGIGTVGTVTVSINDSQGTPHEWKFTRLVDINMYVEVTLTYNPAPQSQGGYLATGGDAAVKAAIATFGNRATGGKDVVSSSISASAFPVFAGSVLVVGVQGVLDVTECRVYTDVIAAGSAWVGTTGYVATPGARSVVTNGGRSYICITAGTSAGAGGPTGTAADITDGTVHWRYLGATITITAFQRGAFDTSRINVHSTPGLYE